MLQTRLVSDGTFFILRVVLRRGFEIIRSILRLQLVMVAMTSPSVTTAC